MPNTVNVSLLEAALIGYEAERQKIQEKIAEIQRQLNGRTKRAGISMAATAAPVQPARHHMSAAARRRIAAAQKKRWAEYRKKRKAA